MIRCCPPRPMRWNAAIGAIARCNATSIACARKCRSVHALRWTCGGKPKPKAVNKPSHHSIMHGLDKPGVFTTVSVLENWGVSSALLVPAKVDLLWFEGPTPVLSYPLPAHWIPEVFWLSLQLPEGWSLKR